VEGLGRRCPSDRCRCGSIAACSARAVNYFRVRPNPSAIAPTMPRIAHVYQTARSTLRIQRFECSSMAREYSTAAGSGRSSQDRTKESVNADDRGCPRGCACGCGSGGKRRVGRAEHGGRMARSIPAMCSEDPCLKPVYRDPRAAISAHFGRRPETRRPAVPKENRPNLGGIRGGPPGDRTRDTLIKSQVLYH
jgi:hypothetical protein